MAQDNRSLAGKVALITGSGNGIGREVAIRMAARGATVAVNDLKQEFAMPTVELIRENGGDAFAIVENVASRDAVRRVVDVVHERTGRLDILVNNAAWVRYQDALDISPDVVDRMLEIGFKSVIWGIQAVTPIMGENGGGSIINLASMIALRPYASTIVYAGVKSGLLGITRAAAAELGPRNIRVNAICPSAIPTEGTEKFRTEERDAFHINKTPLGRLGSVTDIAHAICFLAGDESSFITAQTIAVDGGVTETGL